MALLLRTDKELRLPLKKWCLDNGTSFVGVFEAIARIVAEPDHPDYPELVRILADNCGAPVNDETDEAETDSAGVHLSKRLGKK